MYCQIMSRFIESSADMFDFAVTEFLVIRAVNQEFVNLNEQTELLYWRSLLIHWHMMTNSFSFLSNVVSINCLWISSEIFCCNTATLTDSFQSSSFIKFKNLKKKACEFLISLLKIFKFCYNCMFTAHVIINLFEKCNEIV